MSNDYQHIVDRDWCKTCRYDDKSEQDDPCFDCLSDIVNYATRKPTKYEEAEHGKV